MEGLVDIPLRDVRVFRGLRARLLTERVGADAVTTGTEIYMAPGKGSPQTASGRALLAHELGHIATQAGMPVAGAPRVAASPLEDEASALRLEHAVQRQEVAGGPPDFRAPPARPRPSRGGLSHGSPGAVGAANHPGFGESTTAATPRMVSLQAPRALNGPPPSTANGVARADRDRTPATAEPGGAEVEPPAREDEEAAEERSQRLRDEVIKAVLRMLRQTADLERERRGAFRSEIGG
jgi:hypothetical protein